jgi:hypothetical protein
MLYNGLSLPPESIDPPAAEHETITVIAAMAAIIAAAVAAVAALRYFALRIMSFLCLFTGLFDSFPVYMHSGFISIGQ